MPFVKIMPFVSVNTDFKPAVHSVPTRILYHDRSLIKRTNVLIDNFVSIKNQRNATNVAKDFLTLFESLAF